MQNPSRRIVQSNETSSLPPTICMQKHRVFEMTTELWSTLFSFLLGCTSCRRVVSSKHSLDNLPSSINIKTERERKTQHSLELFECKRDRSSLIILVCQRKRWETVYIDIWGRGRWRGRVIFMQSGELFPLE